MKQSPLRSYVDDLNDLPADVLLGRLVLFTISDEAVTLPQMEQWFTELGLDKKFLPHANRAHDAFKKATTDAKDTYPMSKGRAGHLLCREVTTTSEYVRRQITREIKDGRNKRLSYDQAIECTFYRATNGDQSTARLTIKPNLAILEGAEVSPVQAAAQAIYERYQHNIVHMDGMKLRACVRDYLGHLNALQVKGGVYFVHATRDAELASLAALVAKFGGECQMNMIPMVDLERQRKFITTIFEREASQSLSDLTREVRAVLASGKSITGTTYARLKGQYDEVMDHAVEHTETLQVSQDVTAASAEVAQKALMELMEAMLK